MRVLRCGDRAALVEVADLRQAMALHAALRADPPEGAGELVPAARTLLVRYDPGRTTLAALAEAVAVRLAAAGADADPRAPADPVEVPVRYDGDDLAEVAGLTGLSEREVVRRHTAGEYVCAFCGFAPGFGYLAGLDEHLRVPRRASPRQAVPAGSVAIADGFTAVYPHRSPGGWHLVGHTDLAVWDLDRDPPALLAPGTRVRFVETR